MTQESRGVNRNLDCGAHTALMGVVVGSRRPQPGRRFVGTKVGSVMRRYRQVIRTPGCRLVRLTGFVLGAWVTICVLTSNEQRAVQAAYPLQQQHVGPDESDGLIVPTGQLIRPAGQTLAFGGRPVDLGLSADQRILFVKNTGSLMVLDATRLELIQELTYPKGEAGSMHGLAVSSDGAIYVTGSYKHLLEARRNGKGHWQWAREIPLSPKTVNPTGVALAADGRTAYVGLSVNNALAVVDLGAGKVTGQIPTGICPFDVLLSADGQTAYVSNFGGRRRRKGEHTEPSAGTPVVVDDRSLAINGTISRIDLAAQDQRRIERRSTSFGPGAVA